MHDHTSMMDHNHHESESTPHEYLKFAGVILVILLASYLLSINAAVFNISDFLRNFMGVFFLVFGMFKLLDLKGFASSFSGYDIIAKRSIVYAYAYPFIEIALAVGYFLRLPYIDWITLVVMAVGSIGVLKELKRGSKIKCACLGTFIKLPLTTISLIEDVGMGLMALLMILKII